MSEVVNSEYIIEPWDHLMMTQSADGSVHDQYVPPELETLARQVMERYDMSVSDMMLITAKPDKGGAIWRIGTDKGPRSIKVLHRMPNRSLFSIGAQDYLVQQGARVPPLIPTREGNLYVVAGGKSWIVTEWVEPLEPVSKVDLTGVRELCRGLGEFHSWSRGYVPPFGAVKASRLHRWPQHYEKIITKLQWFQDIAEVYSEFPASNMLLEILPQIRTEAADYYMMFRDSAYRRMIAMGEPHWGMAHQDYGWSNGQMGPGGIWIIDLDGVAYDIPIRDLRKLITSTMVDNGAWDINWVRGMIEAYNEGNPIDRETFELLWIDMAFPNEFYKHVKEIVYEPEIFIPTELEAMVNTIRAVEMNKWDVLNELRKDMELYPSGNYPEVEDTAPFMMPIALPGAAAYGDLPKAMPSIPALGYSEAVTGGHVAEQELAAEALAMASMATAQAGVPAQPFFSKEGVRIVSRSRRRKRTRQRAVRRRMSRRYGGSRSGGSVRGVKRVTGQLRGRGNNTSNHRRSGSGAGHVLRSGSLRSGYARKSMVGRRVASRKRAGYAMAARRQRRITSSSSNRLARVNRSAARRTSNSVTRAIRATHASALRARARGTASRRPWIQRQSQSQQRSVRARRT